MIIASIAVMVAVGIALGVLVFRRPSIFWPAVVVSSIFWSGAMISGWAIVDEFMLLCILSGGFAAFVSGRHRPDVVAQERPLAERVHELFFMLFISYLLLQSIRGSWVMHDIRICWFTLFYSIFLALAIVARKRWFSIPDFSLLSNLIVLTTFVYFIWYLGNGFYAENVQGVWRYDSQGSSWVGTSVAVFPALIALPAVAYLFRQGSKVQLWLALAAVAVMVFAGQYYSSRILEASMLFFFLFLFVFMRFRRFVLVFMVYVAVYGMFQMSDSYLQRFGSLISSSRIFAGNPHETDVDRLVHFYAALEATMESPNTIILGRGYYSHREIMNPIVKRIMNERGVKTDNGELVRTATFCMLLVDTGFLGLSLFLFSFLAAGYVIFLRCSQDYYMGVILLFSLTAIFLTTFLSQNYILIMFYLAFMPYGLLARPTQ